MQYSYSSWLHAASSHVLYTMVPHAWPAAQDTILYCIHVFEIELTIFSNRYYIAHTRASFTTEGLWLMELVFSDKELQHHYCITCSWCHVFTTSTVYFSSTITPISSGDTTHISKRFLAGAKQVIVVAKAYFCLICCQLKIFITICGGQI